MLRTLALAAAVFALAACGDDDALTTDGINDAGGGLNNPIEVNTEAELPDGAAIDPYDGPESLPGAPVEAGDSTDQAMLPDGDMEDDTDVDDASPALLPDGDEPMAE